MIKKTIVKVNVVSFKFMGLMTDVLLFSPVVLWFNLTPIAVVVQVLLQEGQSSLSFVSSHYFKPTKLLTNCLLKQSGLFQFILFQQALILYNYFCYFFNKDKGLDDRFLNYHSSLKA